MLCTSDHAANGRMILPWRQGTRTVTSVVSTEEKRIYVSIRQMEGTMRLEGKKLDLLLPSLF